MPTDLAHSLEDPYAGGVNPYAGKRNRELRQLCQERGASAEDWTSIECLRFLHDRDDEMAAVERVRLRAEAETDKEPHG